MFLANALLYLTALGWMEHTYALAKKAVFSSEKELTDYLNKKDVTLMVQDCKRMVTVDWASPVVPYADLNCEVAGSVQSVEWYYYNDKLATDSPKSRFKIVAQPVTIRGHTLSNMIRYTLRITFATDTDNGLYKVRFTDPSGKMKEQEIFLDISIKDFTEDGPVRAGKQIRAVERERVKTNRKFLKKMMKERARKRRMRRRKKKEKKLKAAALAKKNAKWFSV